VIKTGDSKFYARMCEAVTSVLKMCVVIVFTAAKEREWKMQNF
jgi:hypothetical protein